VDDLGRLTRAGTMFFFQEDFVCDFFLDMKLTHAFLPLGKYSKLSDFLSVGMIFPEDAAFFSPPARCYAFFCVGTDQLIFAVFFPSSSKVLSA